MPRTLVLDGPRRLRLSDQPTRPLRAGEIRLRAMLSGISHGTELSLYRGTSAFTDKVFDRGLRAFVEPPAGSAATYPVTLGYEMVGQVTEVAPDVTEVAVGDLVHTGTPHQEETVLDLAASLRATYPMVRLPTDERPERALFISLAAVALQAVHDAEMKLGDAVSVHGLGTVGLQIREQNGGAGVDVAIEVSGTDRGLQGALEAAGLGATVVAAGFYQGGAANVRLGEEFHHNRLSLIASIGAWGAPHRKAPLWNRRRVMDTATRLLYTDRVSVDGLLTRRFPFDQAPAAYRWIDEHPQEAVKVALTY